MHANGFGTMLLGLAIFLAGGGIVSAQTDSPAARTDELAFMAADTNGDRLVDEAELAADQAERFKQLDANGDGVLTPDELEAHATAAFVSVDADGDGKLTFIEVMNAKMQDFTQADTNDDERVSWDELTVFENKQ